MSKLGRKRKGVFAMDVYNNKNLGFFAKYEGECQLCEKRIKRGQRILKAKTSNGFYHADHRNNFRYG